MSTTSCRHRRQAPCGALGAFGLCRNEAGTDRRKSELARNLQTLIEIRDDLGEGFAGDRTVRIRAVQAIEGTEGKASVTVNVNQQTNVAQIQPGYVIRLPALKADRGAPAIEQRSSVTIEQEREPLTIDQAPEPVTAGIGE
jgi:hypothetical protein